jgi:hypothetical protein
LIVLATMFSDNPKTINCLGVNAEFAENRQGCQIAIGPSGGDGRQIGNGVVHFQDGAGLDQEPDRIDQAAGVT